MKRNPNYRRKRIKEKGDCEDDNEKRLENCRPNHGGPARKEKAMVWVPKYGPMGGFRQKISGLIFLERVWDWRLARRLGRAGSENVDREDDDDDCQIIC